MMDPTMMEKGSEKPESATEDGKDVYYLPSEVCGGKKPEMGKILTLKVVEEPDEQGRIGVSMVDGETGDVDQEQNDAVGKKAFGESY